MYTVVYQDGKKVKQGELVDGSVSVAAMKSEYRSLAKKALQGKEFLQEAGIGGRSKKEMDRHDMNNEYDRLVFGADKKKKKDSYDRDRDSGDRDGDRYKKDTHGKETVNGQGLKRAKAGKW